MSDEKTPTPGLVEDGHSRFARCSTCGKRVSNYVSEDLIVRAYVECPECVGACSGKPKQSPSPGLVEAARRAEMTLREDAALLEAEHFKGWAEECRRDAHALAAALAECGEWIKEDE